MDSEAAAAAAAASSKGFSSHQNAKRICNKESVERGSVSVMHKARERGKDTTKKRHNKKGTPLLRL
jgi:hypothetical protein